ncbi:MAG TPA: hypothetical protein VI873_03070, partial [Candidatus Peribacteraceae bacterium]|nr:hypothetical protein [Candidatus Peribacteraceae bacterium]
MEARFMRETIAKFVCVPDSIQIPDPWTSSLQNIAEGAFLTGRSERMVKHFFGFHKPFFSIIDRTDMLPLFPDHSSHRHRYFQSTLSHEHHHQKETEDDSDQK